MDVIKEHEKFLQEFISETDRAAVILGAAKIDEMLYRIIIKYMLPSNRKDDELLGISKPLGSFSAKIDILYRLGLIKYDFKLALHIIRKLRNSFAHDVEGCSFDLSEHRNRVKELVKPYIGRLFFDRLLNVFFGEQRNDSVLFRTVISIHMARLSTLSKNIERVSSDHAWAMLIPNLEAFESEQPL